MKIAITSMGDNLESKVSERFGRAPYFIIYDTDTGDFTAVKNGAEAVEHGAGPRAVKLITDSGADVIITGNLGVNAMESIKSSGMKYFTGITSDKTVSQIIEEYKEKVK
jgi:predicted Fe-Mo cluster-binding NifX family protein